MESEWNSEEVRSTERPHSQALPAYRVPMSETLCEQGSKSRRETQQVIWKLQRYPLEAIANDEVQGAVNLPNLFINACHTAEMYVFKQSYLIMMQCALLLKLKRHASMCIQDMTLNQIKLN